MSYLCIIQSINYIVYMVRCIDWLHNRHEYWLGTRHDWLGLCPIIPNLGYATVLGFVCKVLIYMNYERCCGLTDFKFTVTLIPLFQLTDCFARVTVLCLVICLTYVSLQVLQRVYISVGFAAAGCLPERPFSTSFIMSIV